MSLLASLCQSLETDEATKGSEDGEDEDDDDDDDGFGGKAEELGLGGAAFKGLMSGMKAREMLPGQAAPAGEVIGGEVLGIICERENTMSG
jgi:gamma-tubulin complex component 2